MLIGDFETTHCVFCNEPVTSGEPYGVASCSIGGPPWRDGRGFVGVAHITCLETPQRRLVKGLVADGSFVVTGVEELQPETEHKS